MLLYIHIPFCDSKCHYCSFNSYVDKFELKELYMDALLVQLAYEFERFKVTPQSIESVFIGGGTPSTIAPALYKKLFEHISPYLQESCEITSEANPNSATKEWLLGMKELGVNRISFGVQSFDAKKLKLLNRAHSSQDAHRAIRDAWDVGIQNISLDLIYATYGDTKELLQKDLEQAFSLPINHISAYALTIEEGTVFEKKPSMSREQLSSTKWLFDTIQSHGFEHYEISNFGTYQSTHNLGYWKYKDYIGLGSGAVGKYANERFYPSRDIELYIQSPCDSEKELLSQEEIKIEKIFLGFRSCVGVKASLLTSQEQNKAELLVQENKLTSQDDTYYNSEYLLADEITLFLSS
jgi:oxygen-independent coproporphyrinogen III oxidase